uniref:SHSP domain-containing protein n=1 Tax=Globodera rostochiensis TaxID=31243 RepID=A0A914H1R1_GLORO
MSQIVDVTHDLATDLWDWPLQHEDGVVQVHNGQNGWEVGLDVGVFRPNEIEINLSGDHLFIYCHHEERVDEHGWVKRELHRSYKVPEDVDTGTIRSHFTANGILQLKALKKHAARRPSINVAVIAEEEPKKEKPKYGAAALAAQKPGKKLVVEVENAKIARPISPISPRENLFASAANFCSTQMPLGPFGWSANNGTLVGKS